MDANFTVGMTSVKANRTTVDPEATHGGGGESDGTEDGVGSNSTRRKRQGGKGRGKGWQGRGGKGRGAKGRGGKGGGDSESADGGETATPDNGPTLVRIPPNIILMVADDAATSDIGAFSQQVALHRPPPLHRPRLHTCTRTRTRTRTRTHTRARTCIHTAPKFASHPRPNHN